MSVRKSGNSQILRLSNCEKGFFEVESSVYYGEEGRTAFRLATQRDLLVTQRLVLQPELELDAYGRDDPEKHINAGLSDLKLGLRLRYELRREIAPYLGVRWVNHFGDSEESDEWQWLAGIRAWF
jgi:copper resistance protein B